VVLPSLRYGEETRAATQYAMPVVCYLYLLQFLRADTLGLYYKLHGVHRPVTMKKSVIKRRKRVVPAGLEAQESTVVTSTGSPESDGQSPPLESVQRGSINPDGSMNLGFRRMEQARTLLPEPVSTNRNNGQTSGSDLGAYISNTQSYSQEHQDSLHDDNRLPPMTSYPSPTPNRPSLSPNTFLSPSRKRSFSNIEAEALPAMSDPSNPSIQSTQPKRLSSIKSILNPGYSDPNPDSRNSPGRSSSGYGRMGSPSMGSTNIGLNRYSTSPVSLSANAVNERDRERQKTERREMLQREADKMREALAAKERELEELGGE
jgi:GATA-binding protein